MGEDIWIRKPWIRLSSVPSFSVFCFSVISRVTLKINLPDIFFNLFPAVGGVSSDGKDEGELNSSKYYRSDSNLVFEKKLYFQIFCLEDGEVLVMGGGK